MTKSKAIPNLDAEQARHGMTNKAVAQKLGMPPSTYLCKKQHRTLSIDDAFALCELFGCHFDYLFARPEDK